MKLLVIDLETTGLYASSDFIVEIGLVLVDTDTKDITLLFDHVVKDKGFNPIKHKNSWVFNNTTLTVEDVERAEPLDSYFDELQEYFNEYLVTAYNKTFDLSFLRAAGFIVNDTTCIMHVSKKYSLLKTAGGKVKTPKMEEIYNQFFMPEGKGYKEQHRAAADAMDEGKILLHLVDLKSAKKNLVISK
jgi:DNA polymerase III epsilon subunit-like protein